MLQEARAVRGAVTALLTSHSLGNGTGAEVEASVQRSLNALLTSRGIVCGDWEVVDLADDGAGGGGGNGSGGGGGGGRSDREGVKLFSLVTSARVAGRASLDALLRARADTSTDVTADSCEGMSRIYCPRIYAPVRTSSSGGGVAVCIGRAVIHRHNRVIVVVLLPDWDSEEGSGSSSGGTSGVGGSSSGASGGTSSGVGTSGAQGAHSQGPWGPHFKVSALSEVLQEYGEGQSIDSNNSSNNSINNNNSSNKGDEPLRAASQQIARRLAVMKPQQFIDFLHTCADGREGGGAQLGQACLVTLCASLQLLLGPESARICRLLGGMEQDGGGLLPRGALAAWAVAAAQVQAQAQVQAATQAREGGYGYGPKRLGSIANIGSIGNIGSMGMGIGAGSQSYGGPRRAASYSSTGSGGDLPLDMGPLSLDDSPALSSPLASIGARISHDLGLPSVSAGAPFTGGSLSPPGPSLPARAHSFLSSLAPPTHTPPPSGATPPAPVPKDLSASARSLRYIYHSPAEHTVKV
ncbi:hypothetical protein B484DRAFT_84176 [Ochromonadaceae sp. CCMP2298]|nr:hypothetical protein B484DRAFT_84176 [Ochromonadaceae sp. CCMP2298]